MDRERAQLALVSFGNSPTDVEVFALLANKLPVAFPLVTMRKKYSDFDYTEQFLRGTPIHIISVGKYLIG